MLVAMKYLGCRADANKFQSLKGFSVGCDCLMLSAIASSGLFQSLKGFSVGCDLKAIAAIKFPKQVSIPERV